MTTPTFYLYSNTSYQSYVWIVLFLLISFSSKAQHIAVSDNYTAQQLVEDIFIGAENSGCVQVSNVSIYGYTFNDGRLSYGYFDKNNSNFDINEGVLLTTGKAISAIGPNDSILSDGPSSWPGDQDLEQAINMSNTVNATALEFDFIANTNQISFEYIFSSEQYLTSINSSSQCNYTDGFAFLIKRVNTNEPYTNLAVVPNTNIPVTVNTVRGVGVCPSANEQYFGSFNAQEHPTNYNGQTKVMTAQTEIIPGETYHIKLVIADQGNNLYDSAVFLKGGSFGNAKKDLGPDRLLASGNPLCEDDTLTLDATTPNGDIYQWYKNEIIISGATNPVFEVIEAGSYTVIVEFAGGNCEVVGEIEVEYTTDPVVNPITLVQCSSNNGNLLFNLMLSEFQLNTTNQNLTYTFFEEYADAVDNVDNITNPQSYQSQSANQIIYVRVTNQYGCVSITEITLATSNNSLQNPSNLERCEEQNGTASFDLTENQNEILTSIPQGMTFQYFESLENALTGNNPIADLTSYEASNNTTIYVKILDNGNCYGIIWFELFVRSFDIDLTPENRRICQGNLLTLSAPSGFSDYNWSSGESTQDIQITEGGSYTVTFFNEFGCQATKTFVVQASSKATITSIDVDDLNSGTNSILINVIGLGTYQYSLDGINYQDSNYFTNIPPGEQLVFVKDTYCGVVTQSILVLGYPKFFTPNGDGFNDYWRISQLSQIHPEAQVEVFDRYGKFLYQFTAQETGWDGMFNSKKLPASDYWFVLRLSNRTIRGHFSLLR